MNVVLIALGIYSREGGMERFNRRVVAALEDAEGSHPQGRIEIVVLWDGAEHASHVSEGTSFRAGGGRKLRFALHAVRAIRQSKPKVVLYGHVLLAPLALMARVLRPGSVHVLIAHGYEVWDRPSRLTKWIVRRGMDRVAAVSSFTKNRMASSYDMPVDRFLPLINAVDIDLEYERPLTPGSSRERQILTVSRLNELDKDKHVDKVILALPEILRRYPEAIYCVVGDGAWRPSLENLARRVGVEDHVRFLGNVDDETRESLYASSELFVLPSTQEGFGIVYLEAWRHRLPVVAGAGGAAPEIVRHQREGVVVDPSPEAISSAVIGLLSDPGERSRLGAAGHERLRSCYTDEHFRRAVKEVLVRATSL
jgi:phosphatidyl-myo-inositol dimannoside synthase